MKNSDLSKLLSIADLVPSLSRMDIVTLKMSQQWGEWASTSNRNQFRLFGMVDHSYLFLMSCSRRCDVKRRPIKMSYYTNKWIQWIFQLMNVLSASYKYRAVHQIWQCYHFFNGISVYKKLLIATLKFITELLKELLKVFGDPPPLQCCLSGRLNW